MTSVGREGGKGPPGGYRVALHLDHGDGWLHPQVILDAIFPALLRKERGLGGPDSERESAGSPLRWRGRSQASPMPRSGSPDRREYGIGGTRRRGNPAELGANRGLGGGSDEPPRDSPVPHPARFA